MEGQDLRAEERKRLREEQLQEQLGELDELHKKERHALSQELGEIAFARKALQDQVWEEWIRRSLPGRQRQVSAELPTADRSPVEHGEQEAASNLKCQEQEDGATSTAGAALNGMQGPEKGDEEKQALLELLPAKTEERVEMQRLMEVLERTALRKAYDYRIEFEDPREIKAAERRGRRFGPKQEPTGELRELTETAKVDIDYVNLRLGYPRLPGAYQEIRKLMDIEKNPIFSKTLDEWNRKEELLSLRRDGYLDWVASVKNEVYQLLAFFSVFQGVVLTAVSTSSLLNCHNMWSPIALSVLASVISTLGVKQKWNHINSLSIDLQCVNRDIETAVNVGQWLRDPGPEGIDFVQMHQEKMRDRRWRELSEHRNLSPLILLALVAFGVLFPISFWRILCKPGAPPPAQ